MKTLVLITGGFDPLHSGHIAYIQSAKKLGDTLVVGVNSDAWLTRKKGAPFMSLDERMNIVKNIKDVDFVLEFNDNDGSARSAIKLARQTWPDHKIIFANGGDRTNDNIPEMDIEDSNLQFVFGVGGFNKANSSSWILQEWKAPKTERAWGYYRVLHEVPGMKVKELTVDPGKSLSMQKHKLRSEYWIISEGQCVVNSQMSGGYGLPPKTLIKHQEHNITVGEWHQLTNPFDIPCKIVEIQYGEQCIEEDIERK
jgi:cytidyltransferase-like protein